jgi:hypothetical protein
MKIFKYSDDGAATLNAASGSFNNLLKTYLLPLGWEVVSEVDDTLFIKNSVGSILKSKSLQNYSQLQGYRFIADITNEGKGFPTPAQSADLVLCKVQTDFDWVLIANEFLFYFILNQELYGFGWFTPTSIEDAYCCFLLGKRTANSTQVLFTNLGLFETSNLAFIAGTAAQIPWSTPITFSYDTRIDVVSNPNNTHIPLSLITIHETKSNLVRGVLPGISILSMKVKIDTPDIFLQTHTFSGLVFIMIPINSHIFAFEVS